MSDTLRDDGHWITEDYRQRMTLKQWKTILLNGQDTLIFHGRLRTLIAKRLGAGVVEIFKKPIEEGR